MKYIYSFLAGLIGILVFTLSSYGDSPAGTNNDTPDYIFIKNIEGKELDRDEYKKDHNKDINDSFRSENGSNIADDIGVWNTIGQDTAAHNGNGYLDGEISLKSLEYQTTIGSHDKLNNNNPIVIDTGDGAKLIYINRR